MIHCTCEKIGWAGAGHSSECGISVAEDMEAEAGILLYEKRTLRAALSLLFDEVGKRCGCEDSKLHAAYLTAEQTLKDIQ